MFDKANSPVPANYFIQAGYIFVSPNPTLISAVLGSSVAVCVYDRKQKFGGMNHFQLPSIEKEDKATACYGNVATFALIRMMFEKSSKWKHLEAQIFGGSHNPKISPQNIGQKNVVVARKLLAKAHIQVVSEDVGGEKGRKIVFSTATNEVAVLKVDKIRKEDWYPYEKTGR